MEEPQKITRAGRYFWCDTAFWCSEESTHLEISILKCTLEKVAWVPDIKFRESSPIGQAIRTRMLIERGYGYSPGKSLVLCWHRQVHYQDLVTPIDREVTPCFRNHFMGSKRRRKSDLCTCGAEIKSVTIGQGLQWSLVLVEPDTTNPNPGLFPLNAAWITPNS